jgi:hypothetical protein
MSAKSPTDQGASLDAASTVSQDSYRIGVGNWAAFDIALESVFASAEHWSSLLKGVTRPWLCWNVDPDWCLVQQRLVARFGWTPVVGGDPRAQKPTLLPNSILLDFNEYFHFPTMWMHFPLEFAFLFAERLAFWHSDLLVREEKLGEIAEMFASLQDGAMAVTQPRRPLSKLFKRDSERYWELIGCTTRGASRSQFENGCGWWMNFAAHPNCPSEQERERRKRHYWDHGAGIWYWAKKCGGMAYTIREAEISEGHCTRIGNQGYERLSPDNAARLLTKELSHNYNLVQMCRKLGLERLLAD